MTWLHGVCVRLLFLARLWDLLYAGPEESSSCPLVQVLRCQPEVPEGFLTTSTSRPSVA